MIQQNLVTFFYESANDILKQLFDVNLTAKVSFESFQRELSLIKTIGIRNSTWITCSRSNRSRTSGIRSYSKSFGRFLQARYCYEFLFMICLGPELLQPAKLPKLCAEFYSIIPHRLGKRKVEVQQYIISDMQTLEVGFLGREHVLSI